MSHPLKATLHPTRTKTTDCLRVDIQDVPGRRGGKVRIDEGAALLRIDKHTVRLLRADPLDIADIRLVASTTPTGGQQIHFICPSSGRTCRVLFADGERIGTSTALRLAYPSQSRSPRRRAADRQEKLIEQLSNPRIKQKRRTELVQNLEKVMASLKGTDEESWLAAVVLEDQGAAPGSSRRRVRVLHPPSLSSRAALMEGRRTISGPTSNSICKSLDYYAWLGLFTDSTGRSRERFEPAIDYPFLDIRDFRVGQGHAPGRLLVWPKTPDGPLRLQSRLDERRGRLLVCVEIPGSHRVQVIDVVDGQRKGDRFMLCPVTGQRHLRMYFRAGRFAGRAAQNLMTATEWDRWRGQVGR